MLRLSARILIVRVGHVESGSRGLNVQVNGVVRAGAKIESVEEGDLIARVMKRLELGRIGWRGYVREKILQMAARTGVWARGASEYIFLLKRS